MKAKLGFWADPRRDYLAAVEIRLSVLGLASGRPLYELMMKMPYIVISDGCKHRLTHRVELHQFSEFLDVLLVLLVLCILDTWLCEVYFIHHSYVVSNYTLHISFLIYEVQ